MARLAGARTCSVEGCEEKHCARGLCSRHYKQAWVQGAAGREKLRAYEQRYRSKNLEAYRRRRREYMREYRKRNPDKFREWVAQNRDKMAAHQHARNAFLRTGDAERITLVEIAERDGWRCHICGGKVTRDNWSMDHLVPVVAGGRHRRENVSLAHRRCNARRGTGRIPAQLRLHG